MQEGQNIYASTKLLLKTKAIYQSPIRLLIIIIFSVFTTEALIMFFLSFLPSVSTRMWVFLDATFLIIILSPILYFFGFRPLIMHINERKLAQETTKLAYAELDQVFQTAADGMRVIDKDYNILRMNETFAALSGINKEEAIGKKCYEVFPGPQCHTQRCSLKRVFSGEERIEFEALKERTDGKKVPCIVSATPFRSPTGKLIGIVEDFRDITEIKLSEKALIESEERYRIIFETTGTSMIMIEENSIISLANAEFEKLSGYTKEELECKKSWLEFFIIDDLERLNMCQQTRRNDPNKVPRSCKFQFIDKYNNVKAVLLTIALIPGIKNTVASFLDITEWKQAEEALKKSEEEKRIILDAMSERLSYRDIDMKIVWANRAFIEATGLTPEEIRGRYCYEILQKRSDPCPNCPMHLKILETGESQDAELTTPDGKIWFVRGNPVRDSKGTIIGTVEISTDITERKVAEREIEGLKKQIEFILGATKTGLDIIDSEFNIRYIDPEWQKVYGDPTGRKCYEYFMGRDEPCPDCGIPKSLETKTTTVTEAILVKENNRPIQVTSMPFQDEKGEWLVAEVNVDITERKKAENALRDSEEKLEAMLHSIGDHMSMMDRDLNIIWANDIAKKIFGDEIIGKKCYKAYHGREKPCEPYPCLTLRAFQDGKVHEHDTEVIDKNGRTVHFHCTANVALRDKDGNPTAVIEVSRDTTEHKKLEQQLLQAQKMEAVGQLAGGIAHDFNNLLTAIIGYGNLLQMDISKNDPLRADVDQILTAAQRAASLTQALLAFSRKQIISPKPVNLNEVIRILGKLLYRIIGEDIELSLHLTDTDLIIMADDTQIGQVLMNLATNARDAMPEGGSLVISTDLVKLNDQFITAHGYGRPGTYALISIEDTGHGMDLKTKERIFEPFFTTKEVGKGTGLGLAMVYGIIKQHEGYINVYSEPIKGTTFKIYLPLIKFQIEEKNPDEPVIIRGDSETILVAEDDTQVRELTKDVLEEFGYKVIAAVDGEDAVKVFNKNKEKIQLLILDVIMPKKNGKEAYDEIKKVRPDIQALFISGYIADLIHKKGILEEGLNFISKPISPQELLKNVREILNKH